MPFNPIYEPMDIIQFSQNQSGLSDIAPITALTFRINGKMDISCGGANPALQESKSKEAKAIDNVSSGNNGVDFFMVMNNSPEDAAVTILHDTPTRIGDVLFFATKDRSMLNIAYTATFELDITALVRVYLYLDAFPEDETPGTPIYVTEENMWPYENRLTVTTGHELEGRDSHELAVYLEVTESTLDIGGGGVLMAKNIDTNGLYIAADDGVYGYSKVTALIADSMGYYAGMNDVTPQHDPAVFLTEYDFSELSFETDTHSHEWQGPQHVISYDSDYVTIEGGRGIELIHYDYHFTGTAGTIDEGYLNVYEIQSQNYAKIYTISAYDTPVANLLSDAQLNLNNWTPAPVSWTHQVTYDKGVNRLYQVAASGWEDFVTEIDVEEDTDYLVTVIYNCPSGYRSYNNEGRRVYVWNQTWTYTNASPNLSDNRLLGYSAKFSEVASDEPKMFTVRFNSGSNTKVKLEINVADVYDGSSATMIFQKLSVIEEEES
jgi:hypothetical protein